MEQEQIFQHGNDIFHVNADPTNTVFFERHFCKHTKRDLEIQLMRMPAGPYWLVFVIRVLRFYRKHISPKLGNRCVFDPSCSHYAELAFRERGFYRGVALIIARLRRCCPENGGKDEL